MNWFELKNGQYFITVDAPGGIYSADNLRFICKVAEEQSAIIKVTEELQIGFLASRETIEQTSHALRDHGLFVRSYQSGGAPIVKSCLGALCPHAEQDALSDALALSAAFSQMASTAGLVDVPNLPHLSIGLNGCARSCAHSAVSEFHLVAESTGYKLYLGGKTQELPQLGQFVTDNIPADKLAETIAAVLQIFQEQREADESFSDFMERTGVGQFQQITSSSEAISSEESPMQQWEVSSPSTELDKPLTEEEPSLGELNEPLLEEEQSLGELNEPLLEEEPSLGELNEPLLEEEQSLGELNEPLLEEGQSLGELNEPLLEEEQSLGELNEPPLEEEQSLGELNEPLLEEEQSLGELNEPPLEEPNLGELTLHETSLQETTSGNEEQTKLLEEEAELEVEEASADDLARVTEALRSEVDEETTFENPKPLELKERSEVPDVDSELADFVDFKTPGGSEQTRLDKETAFHSQRSMPQQGGPAPTMEVLGNQIKVTFKSGIELLYNLDELFGQFEQTGLKESLRVSTPDGALSLTCEHRKVRVKLGAMEMSIPMPHQSRNNEAA